MDFSRSKRQAGELARQARRRLGSPPLLRWPPVSIVVPNRDGEEHLRRLLSGLAERTEYPALELVLVDNASTDGSLELARSAAVPFPISIVANPHNESFSDACNQGAELAGGELLLFLNNDVEPFERGWLKELVACLAARPGGLAGATPLRPDDDAPHGYSVQHRAIRMREAEGLLDAAPEAVRADPLGPGLGEDAESPVPVGACMLIARETFEAIDGFTHGYLYGGEDIDLGFKVLARGGGVACSGRSLLIHRLGSTRRRTRSARRHLEIGRGNRRLIWERWGPRVRREFELDRLAGNGLWAAPGRAPAESTERAWTPAPGFCLRVGEPGRPEEIAVEGLRAALRRRGHPHVLLRGAEAEALRGLNYDVAVHLRGARRFVPKPAQLNVLWTATGDQAPPPLERARHDLVASGAGPDALIDAALARAAEVGHPTRIEGPLPREYGRVEPR